MQQVRIEEVQIMIRVLNQLKEFGVHSIISDEQIILEIFEENLNQADQIDGLIKDLLTETENSNFKKSVARMP
ncbi:hypothetical protein [Paucisalibacillus sp. EB02]|uniref:hypothetical protein n=1 Tax=Paucisalibacillus sp. EB02 TaxID=1347087 RepID=UPI0012DBF7B4|nr:hypothetical protein [Paucisalibacillus sp. EB02]